MPTTLLTYSLSDGYLQNWLVAGPLSTPVKVTGLPGTAVAQVRAALRRLPAAESGVTEAPVELGPLGTDPAVTWRYYRCRADHFVDFTSSQPAYAHLRAFAYAQVVVPAAQPVELVLTTHGPADVWVNGAPAQHVEHFDAQQPRSVACSAVLQAGSNELLVRFETAGVGDLPFVMALRLIGVADAQVVAPTNIEAAFAERRKTLEEVAETATLDRYVYGYFDGDRYDKNEPINLSFPSDLAQTAELTVRVQSLHNDIFQERTEQVKPGAVVPMARTFPLRGGPHHLAITPNANDYYKKQLRFERQELFYVARTPYTQKAGATLMARTQEALADAAARRSGSLFTEIAKMALGQMDKVDARVMQRVLKTLEQRQAGSVTDLLGSLLALARFSKKKPRLDRNLRASLEATAANYRYAADDGQPEADVDGLDFSGESQQILYHACEILAGQLLSERLFAVTGETGAWHRQRGEAAALAWLRQRGAFGFVEWHSPAAAEVSVAALAALVDLAESETVRELAAVLLDKLFFGLAVNSFEGAYGASRGRTDTASVLSARLEPTSGLARLLWARGNFNEHVLGVVSLALCRQYQLPDVISHIATDPVEAFWSQERQVQPAPAAPVTPNGHGPRDQAGHWAWEVQTAVYKSKDFMLACAQDYAPGARGQAEHIWQATLGPDAVVSVNHPANLSLDDAHRPNFWAGNGVLPRAAQWGDVLLALYRLPEDAWLGYTHAYFPAAAFDEYALEGQWAFARKGTGYLALRAAQGLDFVTSGPSAHRELRSIGRENVWLCHMGQALLDGSFAEFQAKLKALDITTDGLKAQAHTLRGDRLEFGWEGPLLVNGAAQPLAPGRHVESPYCIADLPAAQMDLVARGAGVRLKFE